jgi:vacuolar iron transporter family protein
MPHPRRSSRRRHAEAHRVDRAGWLRATVLGANDGILSTGALLLGVVGAGAARPQILTAGVAGLVAGAASMAIGEYVSVSSQRDSEHADRATEAHELAVDPVGEHAELRAIYEARGLPTPLADDVATALMAHDPLGAHLRDELGLTEELRARPLVAAGSSFLSFVVGALIPLLAVTFANGGTRGLVITVATLVGLTALGGIGAALGGAGIARGSFRVGVGGAAALAFTYLIGSIVGTTIG